MSAYDDNHKDEPFPSMGIMQPDETPVWPLSRIMFAGVIVTIILQVWLVALYYQYNSHETAKKDIPAKDMMGATKTLGLVLTEARQELTAPPRVIDAQTGRISIPIAMAEQKVLAELQANPEAKVTGPAPPAPAEGDTAAPAEGDKAEEGEKPAEEMKAEEKPEADKKPEEPADESKEESPKEEGEKPAEEMKAEDKKEAEKEETEEKTTEEKPGDKEDADKKPADESSSTEEPKEESASPEEEGDESTSEEDTSTEPEATSDE